MGNERGNYEMRVEPQHVDGEYEVPGGAPGGRGLGLLGHAQVADHHAARVVEEQVLELQVSVRDAVLRERE